MTAQPPDQHHIAFATRAPRYLAHLPCSAVPRIRFLFLGSRFTIHAFSPKSVALPQLRFISLAVASSLKRFNLQECARAGRTKKAGPCGPASRGLTLWLVQLRVFDVGVLAQVEPPVNHQAYSIEHGKTVHGDLWCTGLDLLAHHNRSDERTVGGNC